MKIRRFALLGATPQPPRVRHAIGLPLELTGGQDQTVALPAPSLLILEEDDRGDLFLIRYTDTGQFGGDTWHESLDQATHQAEYEFGDALGPWQEVPEEVDDPLSYALAQIRQSEGRSQ